MAFLKPDKIRTETVGGMKITIKERIVPDTARATVNVASYVKKGQPMKPCAALGAGSGRPRGITVHNTGMISVQAGTNAAEQYARATWPNQAMGGVMVHFYVWRDEIWQLLREDEQGWHAADGASRRRSHRGELVGGNLDTIAIEVVGGDAGTEATAERLVAYLLRKHGLSPDFDVYTHNYWMYGVDSAVAGARKNCPVYILPHWDRFLANVKLLYDGGAAARLCRVQVGAFRSEANAKGLLDELKRQGNPAYIVMVDGFYKVQVGAFANRANADQLAGKLRQSGYRTVIAQY